MIVYLHASDVSDAGRTFGRHRGLDVRHVTIGSETPPDQVSTIVLASFSGPEQATLGGAVDALIINAHGSPGRIHLGGIADDGNDITAENARAFASPFARLLKPISHGGHGVEVHACDVAAASLDPRSHEIDDPSIGFRFLYSLACAFQIRVRGSGSDQIADTDGLFEGTLVEAFPGDGTDWSGHVFQNNSDSIVHDGGALERFRAMIGAPSSRRPTSDPRVGIPYANPDVRRAPW